MSENKRIDLHTHSLFSDGELLPSELVRRADILGHKAIAITDHVDASNIEVAGKIAQAANDIRDYWDIEVIPGVEITHTPIEVIDKLANKARSLGAEIVVVHGETPVEPVKPGTNMMAAQSPSVDIIGHPGLITEEEVQIAVDNDVALEISYRGGHCLGNGHVAELGLEYGADLVVDTDTHAPGDLIDYKMSEVVALGAGIPESELENVLKKNPEKILKKH
ncbi:histidinol phosphate phosphatase domain-containing protein [Methanosphaera cuniculi]|uniref:histidinol phosphate phosphatase domain-containing protein n=1 Tax=Methanosphaera cuniculi TaxID=1077256 RepID=UPI0026F2B2EC|nr:histidinol phosphate phosphatase domain-containing protein [Methanosphaera cuniculi]